MCIRDRYQDGGFTRFNAIDKTKEYGCQGVELVLNDETPDSSTPMEYAKALCCLLYTARCVEETGSASRSRSRMLLEKLQPALPVSYTHLDVYKRQAMRRPVRRLY